MFSSPFFGRCASYTHANVLDRSKLRGMIRYWHRSFFMAGFKSLKYGCVIASSADSRRAGLHTNNLCTLIRYKYNINQRLDIKKLVNVIILENCFLQFSSIYFLYIYMWKNSFILSKFLLLYIFSSFFISRLDLIVAFSYIMYKIT